MLRDPDNPTLPFALTQREWNNGTGHRGPPENP